MPYISSEDVKKIREEIKKEFPTVKFSITREHGSTLRVAIMESPYEFESGHVQLNQYYLKEHYTKHPALDFLLKVNEIASRNEREVVYDSDYGSVPNYYINLHIGKWDKPHKTNKNIKIEIKGNS